MAHSTFMAAPDKSQEIALSQSQKLLRRLAFEMNQVVRSRQADRIHDLRVAIRRFSQLLGVFHVFFGGKDIRKIRRRLKRFFTAAGEIRDCDVALKLLDKSPAAHSDPLRSKLLARRKECERRLLSGLVAWKDRKTSVKWRSALESSVLRVQPEFDAHRMEREVLRSMAKRFFVEGHRAASAKDPEELHEFRITAKKLRYTLELFVAFQGPSFGRLAESLKPTQRLLGDINDCEITRQILGSQNDFKTLDRWLARRQQRRIAEFRQHWTDHFAARHTERSWVQLLNEPALQPQAVRKPAQRSRAVVERSRSATA